MKTIDLLGTQIRLRIDGETSYKTISGAFATMLISLLALLTLISFGQDLFFKENSDVSYSKNFQPFGNISVFDNFPLLLTLVKRGQLFVTDQQKYFNISMNNFRLEVGSDSSNIITNEPIQMGPCILEDFRNNSDSFISQINGNISNFYCVKPNQKIEFYGLIGGRIYNYLVILINRCKNGTEIICKPQNEIDQMLNQVFIRSIIPDYYFDSKNYENPGRFYAKMQNTPISSSFYKRIYLYYKNVEYITDHGILLKNFNNQTYFQFDFQSNDVYYNDLPRYSPDTIAEISITTTQIKDVYFRHYYKLQNLAADIGGIIKTATLILSLVNSLISFPLMNNYIYDSVFYYNDNIQQNPTLLKISSYASNLISKPSNQISKPNNLSVLECLSKKEIRNKKLKINNTKKLDVSHFKPKKLEITLLHILCKFSNSKMIKKKVNHVNNSVNNLLDVRAIIRNTNLSNIYFKTLFDSNQSSSISLINYFPNVSPMIKTKNELELFSNLNVLYDSLNENANTVDKNIKVELEKLICTN